jgi:transcriptional regulator with XRE-family HTH domain
MRVRRMAAAARVAFGQRVREARLRLGLTQEMLGIAIGIKVRGQSYVSQIELGNANLTIESLALISEALGVDIDLILRTRASSPPPADPDPPASHSPPPRGGLSRGR